MDEICSRPGCGHKLGDGYVQLPEDRRLPNPPRFHNNDCAYEERFRRRYEAKMTLANPLDRYRASL